MKTTFTFIVFFLTLSIIGQTTVLKKDICDPLTTTFICKKKAEALFNLVNKAQPPFDWTDEDNNCEDRANGLCILLDSWQIANGKVWCFSGRSAGYPPKDGSMGSYGYHVAAIIFVENKNNNSFDTLVVDPVMDKRKLLTLKEWADSLTVKGTNFYFVTDNKKYNHQGVKLNPTWITNESKFEDTMLGLTGYNPGTWYRTWGKRKKLDTVKATFNTLSTKVPNELSVQCD